MEYGIIIPDNRFTIALPLNLLGELGVTYF